MDINPQTQENHTNSGRRARLKDVAVEVGVSTATVSNAYNRPDQLSEELRKRILEAAQQLGYSGPDPLGRGLRRKRAGAVGVLYTDRLSYAFADPAAVMFFEGVSIATEEAGLGLLLIPGGSLGSRDPEAVRDAAVDGVVIYCMAEDDPLVEMVLARHLPTVLVDQPPIQGVPSVGIDDEGAARKAAEHLIELGHKRIGIVTFELAKGAKGGFADEGRQRAATYRPSRSRLHGYADALEQAGISWSEVPAYECAENTLEQGKRAAEAMFALDSRPTAMLATSDQISFGILEAARDAGISVPDELSVVGFDNVPGAARDNPPLTTISQPHIEKGLRTGRILVARLHGEDPPDAGLLPTELIVRGSTAPPTSG